MLTYAFQVLKQPHYDEIAAEDFENIHDLLAAILAKGVTKQLKQGLYKEYITESIICLYYVGNWIYIGQLIINCKENNYYLVNTMNCL